MEEFYIFIIWKEALWCKKRILKDIEQTFRVCSAGYISWNKKEFDSNLERFYGWKLNIGKAKSAECGKGPFFFALVSDVNPVYEERETSVGLEKVNIHLFDKKALYRKWVGGGSLVHCSNSMLETRHDIAALFNISYLEFLQKYKGTGNHWKLSYGSPESLFGNEQTLLLLLSEFGNNSISRINNHSFLLCTYCRKEILRFLNFLDLSRRNIEIGFKEQITKLTILGEREGELPDGFFAMKKEEVCEASAKIVAQLPNYLTFLDKKDPSALLNPPVFDRLPPPMFERESLQQLRIPTFLSRIKSKIKRFLTRIRRIG